MRKRYSQEKKNEVVAFVNQYNQENGRGGQSAAGKKWKLSPITIKSWLDKAGVSTPVKSTKKKQTRAAAPKPTGTAAQGSTVEALTRMSEIQRELQKLQKEYEALKSKI